MKRRALALGVQSNHPLIRFRTARGGAYAVACDRRRGEHVAKDITGTCYHSTLRGTALEGSRTQILIFHSLGILYHIYKMKGHVEKFAQWNYRFYPAIEPQIGFITISNPKNLIE